MRAKRGGAIFLFVSLAAALFAAKASAHGVTFTEARYCGDLHRVFVTVAAWEGRGRIGSLRWKLSRTNPDVRIYNGADAPGAPDGFEARGAFNVANGFFFKRSYAVAGNPAVVDVSAKANADWGDGRRGRTATNLLDLPRRTCATPGPPPRFVVVNGIRRRCTVVGTPRPDTLSGRPTRDVICGFGGGDRIWAGVGNDIVVGGPGNDVLLGAYGNDLMVGRSGADVMNGNVGFDRVRGEAGNDKVSGGLWGDRLVGGWGTDVVAGGRGFDRLIGGPGRDKLWGHRGVDTFFTRDRSRDRLSGGLGRDRAQVNCARDRRFSIEVTFSPRCG
jgi:Ca2+-binding RTX toxin-like protein